MEFFVWFIVSGLFLDLIRVVHMLKSGGVVAYELLLIDYQNARISSLTTIVLIFFYSFLNNSFINNSSYSKCTLNLCWYWFSLLNKTFNIQWKVKNKCFVVYIILNIVKTITNLTFNHFPTYTTRVCEEKLTKLKTIKVLILAISFIYKAFLNS